jgi:hypothetical protein
MGRRISILTTTAVVALGALPALAAERQDTRAPDADDVPAVSRGMAMRPGELAYTRALGLGTSAAADPARYTLQREYGSPDAGDAARDLPPVATPAPVVQVRDVPAGGFDWGDAGVGAAAMLALFSIVAGSALLVTGRRRGRNVRLATH